MLLLLSGQDNKLGFSKSNKWQVGFLLVALKQCNSLRLRWESTQVVFACSLDPLCGDRVALCLDFSWIEQDT